MNADSEGDEGLDRKARKARAQQRYRQKQKADLEGLTARYAVLLQQLEEEEKRNASLSLRNVELDQQAKAFEGLSTSEQSQASPILARSLS